MRRACQCPLCRGVPTADPDHGYDRALVPAVACWTCGELIGDEPYVLDGITARFGAMGFRHARCATPNARNERALARHAARTRAHVAARGVIGAALLALLAAPARADDAPDVPPHLVLDGDHVLAGDLRLTDDAPTATDVLIWRIMATAGQPTLTGDIISVAPGNRPRLLVLRVQASE